MSASELVGRVRRETGDVGELDDRSTDAEEGDRTEGPVYDVREEEREYEFGLRTEDGDRNQHKPMKIAVDESRTVEG